MRRTQLYLDEECARLLSTESRRRGTTVSALVREAVDLVYSKSSAKDRGALIDRLAGVWVDRTDLDDAEATVRALRQSRRPGRWGGGRKAGVYRRRFGGSHGVEIADALIAAAAHVHGLTLCTRNLRHYPMRDIKKRRV
jgi:predicted nucleic acid-binding protein